MPLHTPSEHFEKMLKKKAKKDHSLLGDIIDAFEKFEQTPVPSSLSFKPVLGTSNRYYIWVPKRKGWRIIFRKIKISENVIYEAIDSGNHDIRREGN